MKNLDHIALQHQTELECPPAPPFPIDSHRLNNIKAREIIKQGYRATGYVLTHESEDGNRDVAICEGAAVRWLYGHDFFNLMQCVPANLPEPVSRLEAELTVARNSLLQEGMQRDRLLAALKGICSINDETITQHQRAVRWLKAHEAIAAAEQAHDHSEHNLEMVQQAAECGSCDGFNSGCEECSGLGKAGHLAALRELANIAHRVAHAIGMPAGFDVTKLPDVVAQRLAVPVTPVGEVGVYGAVWFTQHPHMFPIGTKFYTTQQPAPPVARDVLMAAMRDVAAECVEICDMYSMYDGKRCASEIRNSIMDDKISAVADRYVAQPPAVAVPDSYKVAPNAPTDAMLDAAVSAGDEPGSDYYTIYRAMLAAAPKGGAA